MCIEYIQTELLMADNCFSSFHSLVGGWLEKACLPTSLTSSIPLPYSIAWLEKEAGTVPSTAHKIIRIPTCSLFYIVEWLLSRKTVLQNIFPMQDHKSLCSDKADAFLPTLSQYNHRIFNNSACTLSPLLLT